MELTKSQEQLTELARNANRVASSAMDAWKLRTITSTLFAEIAAACERALKDFRTYGDYAEAAQIVQDAAELLEQA